MTQKQIVHGPVYIDNPHFLMRTVVPEDINEQVVAWLTGTEMLVGLNLPPLNFNVQTLRAYISSFDNKNNYFIGIFSKKNNSLIGFYTIDVSFPHMVALITAGIATKNFEEKAVLWRTIDSLIDYFFQNRGIYKFSARVMERNLRAIFNFKGGSRFELEAVLKNECVTPSGERVTILVFSSFCDDGRKPILPDKQW